MFMMRWRRRLAADEGFSFVEMVVALTVAAMLLTGGAYVLSSSLKTVVAVRANSQAAELISETIEQLRSTSYGAVAMDPTDLSGDPRITGAPGAEVFDPDGTGSRFGSEAVLAVSGGTVSPHISTVTRNDQAYTVARYVTTPPVDTVVATAAYKRATVIVTWTSGGLTHTRQSSTYITLTRRGLPLPNFQSTAGAGAKSSAPITVNAGAGLTLPYTIVNRGARDGFNLSLSSAPSLSMSFDFFHDVDGTTTFDDAVDVEAGDVDGDGVPDTGTLDSDEKAPMLAYGTVPSNAVPGTYIVTLMAASIAQPDLDGSSRAITFYVKVVNQSSCSGCTYTPLYLRNEYPACVTAPCATSVQTNMPMRGDAGTAATLPNFDTNVDSAPGRSVRHAGSTPQWDASPGQTVANWRYSVPQSTTLNGNVLVDLYLAPAGSGSTPSTNVPLTVKAYLLKSTSGSGSTSLVASASGTLTASSSTAFRSMRITIPNVSTTVSNNRFLELKLVVETATSSTHAWVAYDAAAYPSVVWVPVV